MVKQKHWFEKYPAQSFKNHISKRLLFQKSSSKKKTENHIHVTKQFVIREHWGKKNPKSVSRK